MSGNVVVLHDAGYLSAEGPDGRYDLVLAVGGGEWLLLAPLAADAVAGEGQTVIARNDDLDFALRLLAAAAGRPGPFSVGLPCGNRFLRPGRVPAEAILAAFGYACVPSVTAYVLARSPADATPGSVAEAVSARLEGSCATVAEVERIDPAHAYEGDAAWCCALAFAYPGVFRQKDADEIADVVLAGRGLEILGRGELDPAGRPAVANAAEVIRFVPLTVAA